MTRVIILLQRAGIAFLSFHIISIPGRRSGRMRTTVVSPFSVDGARYLLSFGQLDWVRNARVAGWAMLGRGRRSARVTLVEVYPPESRQIVRAFPEKIPAGVRFFVQSGLVGAPGSPEQFEAAANKLVLFRIDPIEPSA